jgi:hypothetical protein
VENFWNDLLKNRSLFMALINERFLITSTYTIGAWYCDYSDLGVWAGQSWVWFQAGSRWFSQEFVVPGLLFIDYLGLFIVERMSGAIGLLRTSTKCWGCLFSCIFKYIWSPLHLWLHYVLNVCICICSYYPVYFIHIWSWSLEINSTLFGTDQFYLFWILKNCFSFTWLCYDPL